MKHCIMTFACLALLLMLASQECAAKETKFVLENHLLPDRNGNSLGIEDKVERNLGLLFDRMRSASVFGDVPDYEGIDINEDGIFGANLNCENFIIRLNSDTYVVTPLRDLDGFQVRGITALLVPRDPKAYKGPTNVEFVVCFKENGTIYDVNVSKENWGLQRTGKFLDEKDMERQNTIKKFVESFRQFYELKDIESLRNIFSDDALIITGRVVKKKVGVESPRVKEEIVYSKLDKETYLNNLENKTFKNNRYINVKFDNLSIKRCATPGKTNFYGVNLRQTWDSSTYKDEGYLFLLWEFDETGEKAPLIHVRSWQPLKINGRDLKKSEIISLGNCEF